LTIELGEDDTFSANRTAGEVFQLGQPSYWTIKMWTPNSGVDFNNAQILNFTRASSGLCDTYTQYDPSETPYHQFNSLLGQQPRGNITFSLPVTARLSCANASSTGENVTLLFYVSAEYNSGTARRRRALKTIESSSARSRRATSDNNVSGTLSTVYTQEDFIAATTAIEKNSKVIVIALVVTLVVCLCCCCFIAAGFYFWKRNQRQREKQAAFVNSNMASVASSMGMNNAPYK
jgi:hypothetical protein